MKLTIKTLQQSTFTVDIEAEKTVKDLKDKIEKDHGKEYPYAAQKLIYSGKILADDSKLAEYNIDEKKFVVLMITRPPPVQKVPPTTVAGAEKQTTTTKDGESASSTTTNTTTTTTTTTTSSVGGGTKKDDKASTRSNTTTTNTTSSSASSNNEDPLALGLTRLGPGVTATRNFISSGLPPPRENPNSPLVGSNAINRAAAQVLSSGESQMASRLATLMSEPHMRQIQDLIQQSPHLVSSTIEAIAGTDPEMYNFITENPDVFVSALNHPPLAGSRSRGSTRSGQQQPSSGEQRSSQATVTPARNPALRGQPDVMEQIISDVTDRDKEAIERLKELGFPEFLAIQAYMACDRDEQLAANLLFQMDQ